MHPPFKTIIEILWGIAGAVWLIGALAAKRTARTQSASSRLIQVAFGGLAILVGFTKIFQFDPLTRTFVPASPVFAYAGLLAAFAGITFAIWARFYLGGNWSSTVTVKENHSLVRRGPYAIVRHPIYSGILLALVGTAMVWREVRILAAAGLVFVMYFLKVRMEEKFMIEQFGEEYREYCRQVKALIPFAY